VCDAAIAPVSGKSCLADRIGHKQLKFLLERRVPNEQLRETPDGEVGLATGFDSIGDASEVKERVLPEAVLDEPEKQARGCIRDLDTLGPCTEQNGELVPPDVEPCCLVVKRVEGGPEFRPHGGDVLVPSLLGCLRSCHYLSRAV